MGTIFGIIRNCHNKGPGKRTTVLIKGCTHHCVNCPTPEAYTPQWQLGYNENLCTSCGLCLDKCKNNCHSIIDGKHIFSRSTCVGCFECIDNICPALFKSGFDMEAEEIVNAVATDQYVFEDGNGICVSGGESLYQPELTVDVLRLAKAKGIGTVLETTGASNPLWVKAAAEYADVIIYTRLAPEKQHKYISGLGTERIKSNLALLSSLGSRIILRCKLIPKIGMTDEYISEISNDVSKYQCIEKLELLPYVDCGVKQSKYLGMRPQLEFPKFESSEIKDFAEKLKSRINIPIEIL